MNVKLQFVLLNANADSQACRSNAVRGREALSLFKSPQLSFPGELEKTHLLNGPPDDALHEYELGFSVRCFLWPGN